MPCNIKAIDEQCNAKQPRVVGVVLNYSANQMTDKITLGLALII